MRFPARLVASPWTTRVLSIAAVAALMLSTISTITRRVVLDTDVAIAATDAVIDDPLVRAELVIAVREAIDTTYIGGPVAFTDTTYGRIINGGLDEIAGRVVESDGFQQAYSAAIVEMHAFALGEQTTAPTIDTEPITEEIQLALADLDPLLATAIPPDQQLVMDIPGDRIPNVGWIGPLTWIGMWVGAALALLAGAAATHLHRDRGRTLRTLGMAALVGAGSLLALFVGLTPFIEAVFNDKAGPVLAVYSAVQPATALPVVVLALVGLSLFLAGVAADRVKPAVGLPTIDRVGRTPLQLPAGPAPA